MEVGMSLLRIVALPFAVGADILNGMGGGMGPSRVRQLLDDEREERELAVVERLLKDPRVVRALAGDDADAATERVSRGEGA
jgi:hypothetical protein